MLYNENGDNVYNFRVTNDIDMFDKYVEDNNGSFFQTSMWAKLKKDWQPTYFIGTDENDKVVLTALLQTRTIYKIFKLGYFHSGFVCDYNNNALLEEAFKFFKKELKKRNIAFTFIDPEIIYKRNNIIDDEGKAKKFDWLKYGLSFTNKKEPFIQPSFTYILNLSDNNKQKTIDEVVSNFEKGVRYSIRTASNKGLRHVQYNYNDVLNNPSIMDEFMSIMQDTSSRLETVSRSRDYFLRVMENLKEYITLDMIYYDIKSDKNNYEEIKKKNDKNLLNQLDAYEKRVKEIEQSGYDLSKTNKIYLAAGITVFYGETTTCLFGGTRNLLRNATRSSHYLNYKRIENSVSRNMKYHDFLRAHVYYRDERDQNYGLSVFKKSFGAIEIEYIGEYVLINNKFIYSLFNLFYKKILKLIIKLKRKRS